MDQKYLVSVENGAGSLSNTEIGKKTLDMRISSEYSYNVQPCPTPFKPILTIHIDYFDNVKLDPNQIIR